MTVAELKKELEKYNDNDVIMVKSVEEDPWSGHTKTVWYEVASFFSRGTNYKIVKNKRLTKNQPNDIINT